MSTCLQCRLLDANAVLEDAFASTLAANSFRWESALQLAQAAATSPAVLTGAIHYLYYKDLSNAVDNRDCHKNTLPLGVGAAAGSAAATSPAVLTAALFCSFVTLSDMSVSSGFAAKRL